MHYLVTGGAGFIGSHIVETLLKRGDTVSILDNFVSGRRENVPEDVEIIETSINDYHALVSAFQGVDGVFHCAALPSVELSFQNPLGGCRLAKRIDFAERIHLYLRRNPKQRCCLRTRRGKQGEFCRRDISHRH